MLGQYAAPPGIMGIRINVDGLVGPAVDGEVGLRIPFQAEMPDRDAASCRVLAEAARDAIRSQRRHAADLHRSDHGGGQGVGHGEMASCLAMKSRMRRAISSFFSSSAKWPASSRWISASGRSAR